jgi:hypothetical protein
MKRRNFIKTITSGTLLAGVSPLAGLNFSIAGANPVVETDTGIAKLPFKK